MFPQLHLLLAAPLLAAGDWTNSGGNAGRHGLSAESGPSQPTPLWSGGRPSIIAWHPVTLGRRVFQVRQTGFPASEPGASPVVAQDLDTGAELWAAHVPFNAGEWTTWVLGARDGRVYASRSGNGASVLARVHALDAASGAPLWTSTDPVDAGAYDGVVFAPDGDLVIGSFRKIWRIRASDGTTAWVADRLGSVSGNCGVALHGDAVYAADAAPGGHVVKRFDLATGAFQYQGPLMAGFTLQNSPFTGPEGTIYLSRTQNNAAVDFFYAFEDDGAQITLKWSVPAAWSTSTELAVGPDGSVYHYAPGNVIRRLDPATGATLATSLQIAAGSAAPHLAVDAHGRVHASNGGFAAGAVFVFDRDLAFRWQVAVTNINIGGPVLGEDGTLLVAGIGGDVRAYRTDRFPVLCAGDGSTAPGCPCAQAGIELHGCPNSVGLGRGAVLTGEGTTAPDTAVIDASGMPASALHVFLQGDSILAAGVAFGDGLRCAGGQLLRLVTRNASAGASRFPDAALADPTISARAAALGAPIPPGAARAYQVWYRDPSPGFCPPPAGSTSNVTNAVRIDW